MNNEKKHACPQCEQQRRYSEAKIRKCLGAIPPPELELRILAAAIHVTRTGP